MSSSEDAVRRNPFWSPVRDRHPDLDIVVLPPAAPPRGPSGLEPQDPEPFAAACAEYAAAQWARLIDGSAPPAPAARWIPGPTPDAVCHESTLERADIARDDAAARLGRAAEILAADGWYVFRPPTGAPRVTAGREGALGREELLLGWMPQTGRLFLRIASAGLPVGTRRVHELIGSAA